MDRNIKVTCALLLCCLILMSCSKGENSSDLQRYIANLKKKPTNETNLLDHFHLRKPPENLSITDDTRNPFPQQNDLNNSALLNNKPPLERYPLDVLHLMGTIHEGSKIRAVILAPDHKIYEVMVGDRVGNQQGKITNITENKMTVVEPANPAVGILMPRTINLVLKG